jgi:hypothetical protein
MLEAWPDRHPYCVERPRPGERLAGALVGGFVIVSFVVLVAWTLVRWAAE